MILSAAIQHHPSRDITALRQAVPGAAVVTDTEPDTRTSWPTAREAWRAHTPEATHHLFLEDDAVPCARFMEGVRLAVEARPEHAIAFWANRAQVGEALERGEAWTWCGPGFHGTVCVLLPTLWIEPFIAWGNREQYDPGAPGGHDQRLREWMAVAGGRILLAAPCLVQHGAPDDSLVWASGGGNLPIRRVTSYFADDWGIDVTTHDWRAGDG